jgi:hypothetical protein
MPTNVKNGKQETKILFPVDGIIVLTKLDESPTARAVRATLPLESRVNDWGQEFYFDIPVEMPLAADSRSDVAVGDAAFWPQGKAMCLFFGSTPASVDNKPRAYSPVNIFGRLDGDAAILKKVPGGATVTVTL